jgi:replicative DNA helicase
MTNLEQVPPHDLDAESAILSSVMVEPTALGEVDHFLRPEHFYADANRRIYECVLDLSSTGKPFDAAAIIGWLRDRNRLEQIGGTPYLAQVIGGLTAGSRIAFTAMRIVDKWRLRRVIEEARAIIAEAYAAAGDVGEFIQSAESRIFSVSQEIVRASTIKTAQEVMKECVTETAALRRGDLPRGVSTGFESLNKRIGGLRNGRMYVAAGRPGMGKTSFVTKIARVLSVSKNDRRGVYLASVEMPAKQIGDRIIAQETMLDTRCVEMGVMSPNQWQKYTNATAEISRWPLIIEDKPSLTLSELRSSLRRAVRKLDTMGEKLGLVAVDYFQLMGSHDMARGLDTNARLEQLSAGLLGIAKEFDIPLVLLSQLNRECEKRPDKRPQLSDLRGSGALEQDAHTIIFFYRDDVYRKADEQKDRSAEFIVAKCRGGRTGTVRLDYLEYCTEFVDKPDDDPADEFAQQFDDFGDDGRAADLPDY